MAMDDIELTPAYKLELAARERQTLEAAVERILDERWNDIKGSPLALECEAIAQAMLFTALAERAMNQLSRCVQDAVEAVPIAYMPMRDSVETRPLKPSPRMP